MIRIRARLIWLILFTTPRAFTLALGDRDRAAVTVVAAIVAGFDTTAIRHETRAAPGAARAEIFGTLASAFLQLEGPLVALARDVEDPALAAALMEARRAVDARIAKFPQHDLDPAVAYLTASIKASFRGVMAFRDPLPGKPRAPRHEQLVSRDLKTFAGVLRPPEVTVSTTPGRVSARSRGDRAIVVDIGSNVELRRARAGAENLWWVKRARRRRTERVSRALGANQRALVERLSRIECRGLVD